MEPIEIKMMTFDDLSPLLNHTSFGEDLKIATKNGFKIHSDRSDNDFISFYKKAVHEDPLLEKGWIAITELYINKKNLNNKNKVLIITDSGIPKKYIKVLERIMNTKKTGTFEPNIKSFTDASGAGQISSTAGEIMTMMAVSMDEKQFNFLEQKLGEHFDNLGDSVSDVDLILDRDWVESAKGVRQGVSERYNDYYGDGNWEIVGSAWDTRADVEAMGFDYEKKGFSTDAYFRLKVNDEDVSK